ncbi:Arrestin (or S-antigen), C-terminal domain, partial [Halocaridina rubra]
MGTLTRNSVKINECRNVDILPASRPMSAASTSTSHDDGDSMNHSTTQLEPLTQYFHEFQPQEYIDNKLYPTYIWLLEDEGTSSRFVLRKANSLLLAYFVSPKRNYQPTLMVNAVKVYKKTAPNGKITVYLGRRDFVDNTCGTEPVDGVLICDNDYLRGRKVFAAVNVTYRFGREEDEIMGLNFSKELTLMTEQIYPNQSATEPTAVQDRLIKKLGGNAYPFSVGLPQNAPASVQLHTGEEESLKPLGVIYELVVFAGDNANERPHKRNSVTLAVRKIQFSPPCGSKRQPSTLVSKGFALSSGKLNMEVTLDKELYYHGEQVKANLSINNSSKKTVKNIKCAVVQHIELTMTNNQFTRE